MSQLDTNTNSESTLPTLIERPISLAVRASLLGLGLACGSAFGADIMVNSALDDNGVGCTLREAISAANTSVDQGNGCSTGADSGIDRIQFDPSVFSTNNNITLTAGELSVIGKDLHISAESIANGITLIGRGEEARVMRVSGGSLSLTNVTLTGGTFQPVPSGTSGSRVRGGGLLIEDDTVVQLTNSHVVNNTATRSGGGIHINNDSQLSLINSTVSNNRVEERGTVTGGGISVGQRNTLELIDSEISENTVFSRGGSGSIAAGLIASDNNTITLNNSSISNNFGGALDAGAQTDLSLIDSRIDSNVLGGDGGIDGVAGIELGVNSELMLLRSSVANNVSSFNPGGLKLRNSSASIVDSTISGNKSSGSVGASFEFDASIVEVKNSTISNNSLTGNRGYGAAGSITGLSTVYFRNVTISDNTLDNSDSAYVPGLLIGNSSVTFQNTIVANSININHPDNGGDCFAIPESEFVPASVITIDSTTIIESGGCGAQRTGDPGLLPLADNGGSTQTHALATGSIAIGTGENTTCLSTDQRGFARDSACDVGAFEFGAVSPILSVTFQPFNIAENGGTSTATVTRDSNFTEAITVSLTSSDLTSATVPTRVLIPAGSASATFEVSAVDDLIADGNSKSLITASAIGFTNGSGEINVIDNEVPALAVEFEQSSLLESDSLIGTVTRNTPTTNALDVSLSSSNSARISVPATVRIPAGATSATFTANGVNNAIVDASQLITISASGAGQGSTQLTILDDDDTDGDTIANNVDNCPTTRNTNQSNLDGDRFGDACDDDIDGDGMTNEFEQTNGLNPRNPADADADPDQDGFTNRQEFEFGSDPNVPDVDANNNGIPDSVEKSKFTIAPILLLLLED